MTHVPHHPPRAAVLRSLIENLDRRLLDLFEQGDQPDDETIRTIADVETARGAALRMLDRAMASEIAD